MIPLIAPEAPTIGTIEVGLRNDLGKRREQSAKQIEDDEPPASHGIFDVVAEEPEEPHIPQQVHPGAMKKHRS